jgi:hypothetical protein
MFCAAPELLKLRSGTQQFLTRNIPLANQIVPFSDERRRDGDIAPTTTAHQRDRLVLMTAEWTDLWHRTYGAIFKMKLVVPIRPSESLISTLTM